MKRDCWIFYETDSEGNAKQTPEKFDRLSDIRVKVALACFGMPRRQFDHFAELAFAAPNGPGVDMTHWKGEGEARRMVYSARLLYVSLDA